MSSYKICDVCGKEENIQERRELLDCGRRGLEICNYCYTRPLHGLSDFGANIINTFRMLHNYYRLYMDKVDVAADLYLHEEKPCKRTMGDIRTFMKEYNSCYEKVEKHIAYVRADLLVLELSKSCLKDNRYYSAREVLELFPNLTKSRVNVKNAPNAVKENNKWYYNKSDIRDILSGVMNKFDFAQYVKHSIYL